jgi:hypothetical protein
MSDREYIHMWFRVQIARRIPFLRSGSYKTTIRRGYYFDPDDQNTTSYIKYLKDKSLEENI